jgi:hypothetical protein
MPIERRPLPPKNFTAMSIAEADRAEMLDRANDVIDFYLNGPGSYWDAGPRKPLTGETGDSAVDDLRYFKDRVIASKQYVDDPHLVMDSIITPIEQTIRQVGEAVQDAEGRDSNARGSAASKTLAQKRRASAKLYLQGSHHRDRDRTRRSSLARCQGHSRKMIRCTGFEKPMHTTKTLRMP